MNLSVEHRLAFAYDGYISESFLELRVQPKAGPHQTVHAFSLGVGPLTRVYRYADWQENLVHHFNITRYHNRIEVLSRSLVTTHPAGPALDTVNDAVASPPPPHQYRDYLQLEGPITASPALRKFQGGLTLPRDARLGELVRATGAQIHAGFTYQKDVTRFDSTTDDFLRLGAGVCQDFTHLMLGALRLMGVPCRYVSGYLHVAPRPGQPAQSHAWIEFWSPASGWVPYDPTHDREIDGHYVVVAHGRSYDDVPPNKGIYRGNAGETLQAEVRTALATGGPSSAGPGPAEVIEIPVFKEIPVRRADYAATMLVEQAAQQQQQ